MIPVKVDKTDPTDLYQQVAGEIRRAIAEGEATPGERLPPSKDLAAVLCPRTRHGAHGSRSCAEALRSCCQCSELACTDYPEFVRTPTGQGYKTRADQVMSCLR